MITNEYSSWFCLLRIICDSSSGFNQIRSVNHTPPFLVPSSQLSCSDTLFAGSLPNNPMDRHSAKLSPLPLSGITSSAKHYYRYYIGESYLNILPGRFTFPPNLWTNIVVQILASPCQSSPVMLRLSVGSGVASLTSLLSNY